MNEYKLLITRPASMSWSYRHWNDWGLDLNGLSYFVCAKSSKRRFFFNFFFCSLFFSLTLFVRWLNDCVFFMAGCFILHDKTNKVHVYLDSKCKVWIKWCYSHSNESHKKRQTHIGIVRMNKGLKSCSTTSKIVHR